VEIQTSDRGRGQPATLCRVTKKPRSEHALHYLRVMSTA
jgi:hypothetical protein